MVKKTEEKKDSLGVGLDCGTMNFVAARYEGGKAKTRRMRDVFLDLDVSTKKMLRMGKISFVERKEEEDVVVLGDAALEIASSFAKEVRRPLKAGLISPNEADSLNILGLLISSVLGEPREPGEVCYFSVPAAPIDVNRDVVYHTGVLDRIIRECGYEPYDANEAMGIIYSEAAEDKFSGIGVSFGSGMTNVALAVNAVAAGMEFSVARAGDWIDEGAANSLGVTAARMCSIKENGGEGIDLMDWKTREEEAIVFYYRALIDYVLKKVAEQFKLRCQLAISRPIPIIVSGGTSLAGGFMGLFEQQFKKHRRRFPVEISEIRHATKPLEAVARGLLLQAVQEYQEE
jgi:hypothetical protein